MNPRIAIALVLGGMAAGCSLAPRYQTPQSAPPPAAWRELGDWKPAEPADAAARGKWWTAFGNPRLDALEERIEAGNQDLKAGIARLQQARAESRIARAGYFPSLTANSYGTRARASLDSPRFPSTAQAISNDFDLEIDLSYQLDLFGRVRSAANAALAAQQASAADLATLQLTLHAELASDYFALQSADAQQLVLDQAVTAYTKSLQLTRNLFDGGAVAQADVDQAKAQLGAARTQATENRLQRTQLAHAIAVLVGENPSTYELPGDPLPTDAAPPPVDAGLPSTLLERRPDIAAAERRVASANAQVGVARAAYFPVFTLTGAGGYNSVQTATLFNAPSRLWSLGASGALTVFDAGLHRAQSAQAHAAFDEQVANYRKAVLTAYGEVEDDLVALNRLAQESASQTSSLLSNQKALQHARYRYEAGATTYIEVVVSENAALQAQIRLLNIQLRRLDASVALIRALGGGWQR